MRNRAIIHRGQEVPLWSRKWHTSKSQPFVWNVVPHRDAKQRLHLAYTYLIEESRQKTLQQSEENEKVQQAQEVES